MLFNTKFMVERPCGFNTAFRLKHLMMSVKFISDRIRDHFTDFLPCSTLRVLERDENHGILALLGAVTRVPPHLCALEETCVALLCFLKKRLEHVHCERLAEAARTRENGDRGLLVEKSRDELRLVGRPVAGLDLGPVAVAHRKRRKAYALLRVPVCHAVILPHRPTRRKRTPALGAIGFQTVECGTERTSFGAVTFAMRSWGRFINGDGGHILLFL